MIDAMRSIVAAAGRSLYRPSADHGRTVVAEWDPDPLPARIRPFRRDTATTARPPTRKGCGMTARDVTFVADASDPQRPMTIVKGRHWMSSKTDPFNSPMSVAWLGSGLPEPSVRLLRELAREYEAPARECLLHEGDEATELSVLVKGRIALTEDIAGRGSMGVMTEDPGDIFGWSALIPPFEAPSTVVSLEPVHVVTFDGAALRDAIRSDAALAAAVYQRVVGALAHDLGATRRLLQDPPGDDATDSWSWFFG
jgi:CRP-like cAMP-binding protein